MVVFFDIDGTIIDEKTQEIPASAVRAVARLAENGHMPVINTGRPYSHIDPRVKAMAFRGYVCGCGMEVRLGDRWLYRKKPDSALCAYVAEAVRKFDILPLYEGETAPSCTSRLLGAAFHPRRAGPDAEEGLSGLSPAGAPGFHEIHQLLPVGNGPARLLPGHGPLL